LSSLESDYVGSVGHAVDLAQGCTDCQDFSVTVQTDLVTEDSVQ